MTENEKIDAHVWACIRTGEAGKAGDIQASGERARVISGHRAHNMRAIDRSLQRLRKRGVIRFVGGKWEAVKP